MPFRNVVILVDRAEHGASLAEVARTVSQCRISGLTEKWADANNLHGVIADVSLDGVEARRCLNDLSNRLSGNYIPLIYILRTGYNSEYNIAIKHGATACMSATTLPREAVSGLFRQIAPEKTMTDLLVEHSFGRAETMFFNMFDAARTGSIELDIIEREIDPIIHALREGGLRRWLDLVLAHDDMTVRHCLLVAGLVTNFAIYLGVPAVQRGALVRAALLHDVGKSQIPQSILNKPGSLDVDETAIMRRHAALGHKLLLNSGLVDDIALQSTKHHHEMLDGSGYPDGLMGKSIKDVVRMITICDIYAALVEKRPYRDAMPQSSSLEIIRSMAPDKLEKPLVEAFIDSLSYHRLSDKPRLPPVLQN